MAKRDKKELTSFYRGAAAATAAGKAAAETRKNEDREDFRRVVMGQGAAKYPEAVGFEILHRLIAGEPLKSICADEGMPAVSAVTWWATGDGTETGAAGVIAAYYLRARAAQAAGLGDEALRMVRELSQGRGNHKTYRVALDGLRWLLGRLDASRWGENLNVRHSGEVTLTQIVEQARKRGNVLSNARERAVDAEIVEGEADT